MFKNFIEPGRVVYVNFGKDLGKYAVIADIADGRRVLLDGPTTGFPRTLYPIKRLGLTSLKVKILKGAKTGTIRKAAEAYKLTEKWAASAIARKFALRAKRASLTDLDRFKVMINRKNRSFKLRQLAKKVGGAAPAKGGKPAPKNNKKK